MVVLDGEWKNRVIKMKGSLAGVAHWVECGPVNQKVAGPIQSWHRPGLRARLPVRGV